MKKLVQAGFNVAYTNHANAIFQVDFPEAQDEIEKIMNEFYINIEEMVAGGGGEASITQRIRKTFEHSGWRKRSIEIAKTVQGVKKQSLTHEIDHVKDFANGVIALEIEWNNKDPFYDRDLENFKRLHLENAISLGVIVTRGDSLQYGIEEMLVNYANKRNISSMERIREENMEPTSRQKEIMKSHIEKDSSSFQEVWAKCFRQDKYGTATTHWGKLEDRIKRGVGNPCPLLLIGLPSSRIRQ